MGMAGIQETMNRLYRILRPSFWPIRILLRLQIGFKYGSSTSMAAVCTTRSVIVGIPNGRSFTFGLGIKTRRTASGVTDRPYGAI